MYSSHSPFSPLGLRTQPDPLYVPKAMHSCASLVPYVPLLVIKAPHFPFLLFPQPQLFPCCPPKLLSRGDLLRPGSKPRQRQHAKVNKRGTNSTSVSSGMFVAACVFHLQRTSQDSLRSCIFDTSQPAQTIRSVVLTGDNVSGRPGPETWREMVKVKAIRGSYSTAALRHIVLLPK